MARILVVDDEPGIVDLVDRILSSVGHEIIQAMSGEEALATLRKMLPDLILLDVMMPRMDGWQTLELIREQEELRNVPVAMLTAISLTPEIAGRGDIDELVDYIEKPFTKDSLIKRVNYSIIDDLDDISKKKVKLASLVEDGEIAESYEISARLEKLHKSILTTLKQNFDYIEPFERKNIREAILSQKKAIEMFKSKREEIERRLRDKNSLLGEQTLEGLI
jgi:CheY-like chemotaxis protein